MKTIILAAFFLLLPIGFAYAWENDVVRWENDAVLTEYGPAQMGIGKIPSANLIARKTAFTPVSSINFNGLHGMADGGYRLEAVVPDVSGEIGADNTAIIVAFINHDMNLANYSWIGWEGGTIGQLGGSGSPQPPTGIETVFYNINNQVCWNFMNTPGWPFGQWLGSGSITSIKFKIYLLDPSTSGPASFINFPKGTIFSLFRLFD